MTPQWICDQCNIGVTNLDGYEGCVFIVHDNLWLSVAKKKDVLCVYCFEKLIRRPLELADLQEKPLCNVMVAMYILRRKGVIKKTNREITLSSYYWASVEMEIKSKLKEAQKWPNNNQFILPPKDHLRQMLRLLAKLPDGKK